MVSHTHEVRVRWGDVDYAGIAFYPEFFRWFDEAADEFFRALGLPWERYLLEAKILGFPILEASSQFLAPVFYGELLRIVTRIADLREKTFRMEHEVWRGETCCAKGYEIRAMVEEHDGRRRARPIPDFLRQKFEGTESRDPDTAGRA